MLYAIRNIGVLPGGNKSGATAINNKGEVTGFATNAAGEQYAILWTETDGMKELGALGGNLSAGHGINDNGKVVGQATNHAGDYSSFLWSATTGMQELPGNDGVLSVAKDINNSGYICGSIHLAGVLQAALWAPGQPAMPLGEPGTISDATGINEAGVITGWAQRSFTNVEISEPFTTDIAGNRIAISGFNNLPTYPSAISDNNLIVGSYVPTPAKFRAFMWNSTTGMQDIGTLGGDQATANGVNANGIVVGRSYIATGQDRAFVYEFGTMLDLNTLVTQLDGWVLHSADGINNNGQIVGSGVYRDEPRGYMLTPVNHRGRELLATIVNIITGVVAGNSGWVWPLGWPRPIPQPSPNPWLELSPAARDMMLLVAIKDLSASISDKKIRKAIEKIAFARIKQEIRRMEKR